MAGGQVVVSVWSLVYERFEPEQESLREALCTLGNGYFATRGAAPESQADDVHYPGTYAAGLYNRLTTEISGERVENEDLVNLPNWLPLTFRAEGGAWFDLREVELLEYRQELDLRSGVLVKRVDFRDREGRRTRLHQRRIVHMEDQHLAALETVIEPVDWSGRLEIRSALDGTVTNSGVARYRRLAGAHLVPCATGTVDEEGIFLQVETSQSKIRIAEAARTRVTGVAEAERRLVEEPGYVAHEVDVEVEAGKPVTVEKVVTLFTSRDWAISESGEAARKKIGRVGDFETLLARHEMAWARLWRRARLALNDGDRASQILHLHIFHILQTVSEHTSEHDAGVPARGWHGEAYRGHIFWDELFVFPFLNLRFPDLTRALLGYRFRRLEEARWAARQAGYEGAMYPWQSGSDGREESQVLHLNPRSGRWIPDDSRLQRHIGIAVAYNVWQYFLLTADLEFLSSQGAEMLLEIARFWAGIATYDEDEDRYEILGVMGPDEYHEGYPWREEPGLDNNAYTNVMAVWVLSRAFDVLRALPEYRVEELRAELALTDRELARWEHVSRRMKVPLHDGVISQFEGYERLEEFDWEGYRERYGNIQRLDRILEAEGDTPNRYKASKQADVLMLFYLLTADELAGLFERLGYPFEHETIPRNVEYYLHRTSHGSTLSRVVHSWILARQDRKRSWEFFVEALESDVSDIQGGTTPEGIHLGAMAGTVDLVQRCYTGLQVRDGVLWFDPALPEELQGLQFRIRFREHWIDVEISDGRMRLGLDPHPPRSVEVGVSGEVIELRPGEVEEVALSP